MDLIETLRSTGAVREFTDDPVGDDVVARILDTARFAPSGGNAQAWHVVVIKDPGLRVRLRDLYVPGWRDYLAMSAAGLRPWAPGNGPAAEAAAVAAVPDGVAAAVVALGRPAQPRKRLRRQPVTSFTTVDRADGPVFATPQEGRP